jgi:hypothetical protein
MVLSQKIGMLEARAEETNTSQDDEAEIKFDKKWGSLYEDLKVESNLSIQYYYVYTIRRILFVLIAYYLNPYPGI